MPEFGVHSEVGQLRKVIVHRPGLEMRRLTPTNAEELLFDDVIWARKARTKTWWTTRKDGPISWTVK